MSKAINNRNVILPCPFCGKEASTFEHKTYQDCSKSPLSYFGIGCKTENCYGEQDQDMAYFKSPHAAIKAWNKRSNS